MSISKCFYHYTLIFLFVTADGCKEELPVDAGEREGSSIQQITVRKSPDGHSTEKSQKLHKESVSR